MDLNELRDLYDFKGRTVVITGGTGVLGGEIACALVGCGANVAMLDRRLDPAQGILELMGPAAAQAVAFHADVLDVESLQRAAELILQRFGRVDGLVNAAGGNDPQATTTPNLRFFDLPMDALRTVVDLNLVGTIVPCQVFGRLLAEQKKGSIVNLSSVSGTRPLTRIPAYASAKSAINGFTQWLAVHMAREYSPEIRVNAIAPGFFLTRQNRFLLMDEQTGEWTPRARDILAHTPMGRMGNPEELLGAAIWLLSPLSSFVTGTVVTVDGGFTAQSGV